MKIKRGRKTGETIVTLELGEAQLPAQGKTSDTFQLKRILVPIDFSACSRKALQYAVPFARQFVAELILLHVIQPYTISGMEPVGLSAVGMESETDAMEELESFQLMIGPVVSSTVVREGNPHSEIIQAAKDLNIDLIILSTHGRTGFNHILLGSTTEKIVRHACCPVLVVREHEHEFIDTTKTDQISSPAAP